MPRGYHADETPRDWAVILADAQARDLRRTDVAVEQNVSRTTISHHCDRLGIALRKEKPGRSALFDWPVVLAAAARAGLSNAELAKKQGVSKACITQKCRRYGVTLPSKRQSRSLARA